MDDILSVALGKSGLDLSYLQHEQPQSMPVSLPYGFVTTAVEPTAVEYANVKQPCLDDEEDIADFLNLLADPTSNRKPHAPHQDFKPSHSNSEENVLDFLLNYNSDDEKESSKNIISHSTSYAHNFEPPVSICSQFPRFNFPCQAQGNSVADDKQHKTYMAAFQQPEHHFNTEKKCNSITHNSFSNQMGNPVQTLSSNSSRNMKNQLKFKQVRNINKNTNFLNNHDQQKGHLNIESQTKSHGEDLFSHNLPLIENQNQLKTTLQSSSLSEISLIQNSTKTKSSSSRSDLTSLLKLSQGSVSAAGLKNEDYDEDEDNEMQHSETFAEYWPMKTKIGHKHPDAVVETSSMASVTPPDVWYTLQLSADVINEKRLSALQLESVIYASQQHEKLMPNGKRSGFLIGDGAGVGKGRTIAGIIFENYLHGRKRAIWLSVSNDLKFDAMRDLKDVGYHAKVQALNKFKYDEKISSSVNGKFKKGVIFATYSSLIGETSANARFKSRLQQLIQWCGKDFDGVIIFDECHKAKNLMPTGSSKPTKTGITVLKLQDLLPKARVVYCSATGASEPKNMAYMNRLGLWGSGTAFREFTDFISSVEKRGVGAMEMVAMDMKLRGMYIARQLSFSGVTFDIKQVKLCDTFIEMYDTAVKLWLDAREKFEQAADLVGLDSKGKKTMWGQFWSAHQRFFKYLCIAAKVKKAVEIAKEAIDFGKCVIFGLQSTGEARTLDQIDELQGELNDFISTTKGVFSTLVEKHFPVTQNVNACGKQVLNENLKRKRAWRKNIGSRNEKRKKFDTNVEYMTSSDEDSSDTEKISSANSTLIENDFVASDKDTETEDEEDEKNPFTETSSDEDGSWIKKDKPAKKKIKKKIKNEKAVDPSRDALAAAGFNMTRQFSWANSPTLSGNSSPTCLSAGTSANMRSKVSKKTTSHSGLSEEINAIKTNLKRTVSNVDNVTHCKNLKQSLLDQLEILSPYLPPNTLDELIDELGGPTHVAEMTGRKGRVVARWDDTFAYEARSKDDVQLEVLNVAEKQRFMDGEKLIAVISEAASSGISLQADRRAKNKRRRVHITLELPWSADKAIQQFGRSHRSNQVSAPEYLFLISELAGEQRFASIVAKRLESLGALTHGDRRATESRDLSRFNFDTKYGRQALDIVLKSILGFDKPIVSLPKDYVGSFMEDVKNGLIGIGLIQKEVHSGCLMIPDKDYTNISRFMNRVLGLSVSLQNALFQYFTDTLNEVIKEAKRNGKWDEGIVDLGSQGESVKQVDSKIFLCPATCGQVTTELVTVNVERGLSYIKACSMLNDSKDPHEGFYETKQLRNGKKTAVLVLKEQTNKNDLYTIYRPNVGMTAKQETLKEISSKYEKVSLVDIEITWNDQYEYSRDNCIHAFWRGYCKKRIVGLPCEIGARRRTCHILCGSVLSVWTKVENTLSSQSGPSSKMQIIRAKLDNGKKLVGMLIPNNCVDVLRKVLSNDDNLIQQID